MNARLESKIAAMNDPELRELALLGALVKDLPYDYALCKSEPITDTFFILKRHKFYKHSNDYCMKYIPMTEESNPIKSLESLWEGMVE